MTEETIKRDILAIKNEMATLKFKFHQVIEDKENLIKAMQTSMHSEMLNTFSSYLVEKIQNKLEMTNKSARLVFDSIGLNLSTCVTMFETITTTRQQVLFILNHVSTEQVSDERFGQVMINNVGTPESIKEAENVTQNLAENMEKVVMEVTSFFEQILEHYMKDIEKTFENFSRRICQVFEKKAEEFEEKEKVIDEILRLGEITLGQVIDSKAKVAQLFQDIEGFKM